MFKKAILTISALALSAGMLVSASSTDAEARKYKSRYKKTQSLNFDKRVPSWKVDNLCAIYGCGGGGGGGGGGTVKKSIYKDTNQTHDADYDRSPSVISNVKFIPIANNTEFRLTHPGHGTMGTVNNDGYDKSIWVDGTKYKWTRAKLRRSHYRPTRMNRRLRGRSARRACLRHRRCRAAMHRYARKHAGKRSHKARYLPTRYKRKALAKKRRALKRRRALRKSRYNVTRYKRKLAKRRALKRRRILRKRRALRRSKYKRTSYRGRRHLRRRARR